MTYPIKLVPIEAPQTIATTHPSIPSVDVKDLPVSSLEAIVNEFRNDLYRKAGKEAPFNNRGLGQGTNRTSEEFYKEMQRINDKFQLPRPDYQPTTAPNWPPGTILCGAQDAVGAITAQELPISPTQTR
jgi:hypothetical protein